MPENLLELRVAAKAELGDEAGHRRRADARPLGKPGDALQPRDGVGGEEDAGKPPFRRTQGVEALPDDLADPGVTRRDVCYILPQSRPPGTFLDNDHACC